MSDESRLTYVGHATVLIEQADKRVLTDPALGRMLEGKLWRLSAMPTRRMYEDIDLVLISHLHHDHCDVASLRKVGTDVTILVPAGGGQWLVNQGFSHVIEVSYGDVYVDDGLTVRAVPASHSGRRRGGPIGVALGYIVSGGGAPSTSPETPTCSTGCRRSRANSTLPCCRCGVGDPTSARDTSTPCALPRRSRSFDRTSPCPIHWGTFLPLGLITVLSTSDRGKGTGIR